jgi:tyrosinase
MLRRAIAEPTSWRYQAAIHGYDRAEDPRAQRDDVLPANPSRFWNQCQHSTWFFLPWHRMYLHFFESIVAATVARLGGPADWALPYWNYSDASNGEARKLRPEFYADRTPDGVDNPLWVDARIADVNAGEEVTDAFGVALQCLREEYFVADLPGGSPGFGGRRTGFHHGGGAMGALEGTPHGSIHVAVGLNGWMGGFNTAALDPIFWLHHANIDRLWEVWRGRDATHVDPAEAAWLDHGFEFQDGKGNIVTMTAAQVVDTTADPLRYRYEDVSDPFGGPGRVGVAPRRTVMASDAVPEMVGATDRPVRLGAGPTSARMSISAPTGPARRSVAGGGPSKRVYLNVENIKSEGRPTSYAVYINVPPGADPWDREDRLAGILPMFGVAEASSGDATHGESGLHYSLEVTDVVDRLEAEGSWDPNSLDVTFVPRGQRGEGAPVEVGRVSLYYK